MSIAEATTLVFGTHADFERVLQREELVTAYSYWRSIAGSDGIPSISALDPLDMVGILPLVNLVDAAPRSDGNYRFRHRLLGTELVTRFQAESTGIWFDDLYTPDHLERQLPAYLDAVRRKIPNVGDIHLDDNGERIMAYRRLILPLAGADGAVERLLVVFAFQTTDDQFAKARVGLPMHQAGRGSWQSAEQDALSQSSKSSPSTT